MKILKYIASFVFLYIIMNLQIEDYDIGNISIFSIVALLSSIYIFSLYIIDKYTSSFDKIIFMIIKFILILFSVFLFQEIISRYFEKHLPFSFLVIFPLVFLLKDYNNYRKSLQKSDNPSSS